MSYFLHFIELHIMPLIEKGEIKQIRLFCDSCSGQNQNYSALLALVNFSKKYQISFEWFFPVHGHSYIPADHAFSFVSRNAKKKRLVLPYDDILQQEGNLFIIGQQLTVKDMETAADKVLQAKQKFLISDAKLNTYYHQQDKIDTGAVEQFSLKMKQRAGYKPSEVKPISQVSKLKADDVATL